MKPHLQISYLKGRLHNDHQSHAHSSPNGSFPTIIAYDDPTLRPASEEAPAPHFPFDGANMGI